jgi:arylformamidase
MRSTNRREPAAPWRGLHANVAREELAPRLEPAPLAAGLPSQDPTMLFETGPWTLWTDPRCHVSATRRQLIAAAIADTIIASGALEDVPPISERERRPFKQRATKAARRGPSSRERIAMNLSPADQAALDANYNLRAAVPEHPAYFERYAATSVAFRARWPARLDLPYGDGPRQAIDLFLPQGPQPSQAPRPPLLVFIHGGYWQALDRKDFSFVAEPLVAEGAAVALLGYDLAPAVDMNTIVSQIRQAIVWLHRHAGAHGFDPERICLAGHSAGGHLAAMALATDWRAFGLPADLIKGVCAISGVFDLEPIRLCYLNEVLRLDAEQARRNSPVLLPPQAHCPVMLTVGERETEAFHRQSTAYAAVLRRADLACELIVQPGLDHFAIIMAMTDAANPAVRAIGAQLGLPGAAA